MPKNVRLFIKFTESEVCFMGSTWNILPACLIKQGLLILAVQLCCHTAIKFLSSVLSFICINSSGLYEYAENQFF